MAIWLFWGISISGATVSEAKAEAREGKACAPIPYFLVPLERGILILPAFILLWEEGSYR